VRAEVERLFDEAAAALCAEDGVERGKIFHSQGVSVGGKFFAFVRGDEIVAKLPAPRVAELIASGEGQPFDAGKGKPLREWVRLVPADAARCSTLMSEARVFVASTI
jgi:hypothetical protein